MKIKIQVIKVAIVLFILQMSIGYAQMNDGYYLFENNKIKLELTISEMGATISMASVTEVSTNKTDKGTGQYMEKNGVTWYKIIADNCTYEFKVSGKTLILSESGCKNGKAVVEYILTKTQGEEVQQKTNQTTETKKPQNNNANSIDSYPKASCRITDGTTLLGIVQDGLFHKVSKDGSLRTGKKTQNNNEYCQGTKCIRIVLSKEGYILKYALPNVTDSQVMGKVEGNKIYPCSKKDGSDIDRKGFVTFKGDKKQAAILVVLERWFQ
jgi:hypothetical protein